MSDPSAVVEETPPPQPPRPAAATNLSQMEADEQYARQLAQHYHGSGQYARSGSRRQQPQKPEAERDFFTDDLPEIKETLKTGFLETQKTVNGWLTKFKKTIDGEDDAPSQKPGQYAQSSVGAQHGRRSGDMRSSGDYNRYDADPQVLGDDFAGIQLNEDGSKSDMSLEALRAELDSKRAAGQAQQRRSTRPLANPDLFKPTPAVPRTSSNDRKVAFQEDTSDIYNSSPKTSVTAPSKTSKWQPLSAVDPSPIGDNDNDNDPFSLGDSEDENPNKDRVGGKEVKTDEAERLKKAASETGAGNPDAKLQEAEKVGSKDKEALDTLTN